MPDIGTKLLVLLGAIFVVAIALLWPYLGKIPKKCPACGNRKMVAYYKKPAGKIVTTSYEGGGHGGSGASATYDVTFKCKSCGEEMTQHVAG